MKKKIIYILTLLLILFSVFQVTAFADFGDYAGDSDWGWDSGDSWGGDSWGSSGDWGSSDGWSSSSGWSNGYYYSPSSSISINPVAIVVVVIIIVIVFSNARNNMKNTQKTIRMERPQTQNMVNDLQGLKSRDPGFSESRFLEDASNLYVRMQNAWTNRDLSPIQTKLSSELYAKSSRQLDAMKKNGQTNHVEKISVLSTDIVGCTNDGVNDIITVQIASRICDYVTDDSTGNVLRGDPNRELFMTYQWTFIRSLGKTTKTASDDMDKKCCPNCGAPLDLNQSSVCAYCGTVVESGDYDWVLSAVKGISQQSA